MSNNTALHIQHPSACELLVAVLLLAAALCVYVYNTKPRHAVPPSDAVWLLDDDKNRTIIHAVVVFDGLLTKAAVCKLLRDAKMGVGSNYERCKLKVHQGTFDANPKFVPEDPCVTFEDHVSEKNTPMSCIVDVLKDIESYYHAPFDAALSPWEIILYPKLPTKQTVAVFRISHVFGDGLAIASWLMHLSDEFMVHGMQELVLHARMQATKLAPDLWGIITRYCSIPSQLIILATKLFIRPPQSRLLTGGKRVNGLKKLACLWDIEFDRITEIRKKLQGVTVNELMLVIVAEMLSILLVRVREGRASRETNGHANIPLEISTEVQVVMPTSLRWRVPNGILDNRFGSTFISLPVSSDLTIFKRLGLIKSRVAELKRGLEPLLSFWLLNILYFLLPAWLTRRILRVATSRSCCVVSNVPGPQERPHLNGCAVEQAMFFVPSMEDIPLGVSIFSLHKKLSVGVVMDQAMVDAVRMDASEVVSLFEKILVQLEDLSQNSINGNGAH